jgi:multimeric flavodoxin WrbA
MKLKDCVIRDDDFHALWRRILATDVIVQLSPVYWLGPPGKHKDLIDRSHAYFASGRVLAGKTGYTVSIAGDSGFESHEAIVESWLRWYGVNVKGRLRVVAREIGDAAASAAAVADLKRFAREIAQ